jgi:hypothetical protein
MPLRIAIKIADGLNKVSFKRYFLSLLVVANKR